MILATGVNTLQVVDLDRIKFHEKHEPHRLDVTCEAIRQEGVLRNPPIAMQLRDGSYLILDGAHRTETMMKLQCHRAVLQVITPEQFALEAWNHAVPAGEWLEDLKQDPQIEWLEKPTPGILLAEVVEASGDHSYLYLSSPSGDLDMRLDVFHRIVEAYTRKLAVKRFSRSIGEPAEGTVHMIYPAWTIDELEETVMRKRVMPAGFTRCVVDGRILNLRIPLDFLLNPVFDQPRWEQLQDHWKRSLRLYTEAIYLCEL